MQAFINTLVQGVGTPVMGAEVSSGPVEAMRLEMEKILSAALVDSGNVRVSSHLDRDGRLVEVTRSHYDRVTGRLTYQRWVLV